MRPEIDSAMSFYIRHRFGGDDRDPPPEALDALLAELDEDPDDTEHPDVGVVHESDWAISVYANGLVTLENVEDLDIEPRHLRAVDRSDARRLLALMAQGRLEEILADQWEPGYE
jgi:hypothetical protein